MATNKRADATIELPYHPGQPHPGAGQPQSQPTIKPAIPVQPAIPVGPPTSPPPQPRTWSRAVVRRRFTAPLLPPRSKQR